MIRRDTRAERGERGERPTRQNSARNVPPARDDDAAQYFARDPSIANAITAPWAAKTGADSV